MIDLAGTTILVVDDESFIRKHLAKRLSKLGCAVLEACKGQEAVEKAASRPDVIVMDVKMPLMNGFEATKRIKAGTDTSGIPVILLSAKAQENEIAEGYSCGADSYLTKPATLTQILKTIQKHLCGSGASN